MKRRPTLIAVAAVFALGLGILVTNVVTAQSVPIEPGPCPPGYTCDCNTTIVENVHCARPGGTGGVVAVTVCQNCPPPDCVTPEGPCRLSVCEISISATCQ